jgi:hypothetical protein
VHGYQDWWLAVADVVAVEFAAPHVGGWVVAEDDEGTQHFPIWPHQRFAEACATGPWQGEKPVPLDVDEWVAGWLPDLEEDGIRVAVFQTPDDQGVGVAPSRLKRDLDAELAQFEL